MLHVYGDRKSGNCLKVKWVLDWLDRPYAWTGIDVLAGQCRTPDFLALNPAGQVPVLRLEDGRCLAQSNAIVLHLAERELVPADAFARARMFEWLFWEQYSHEPYVAVRRFQRLYLGKADADIDPKLLERGTAALRRMDGHLKDEPFLAGEKPTAADLCLLPYTRYAGEGGFDLAPLPHLRAWIDRTAAFFGVGPSA